MIRRFLSILCALIMVLSVSLSAAEEASAQPADSNSFSNFYRVPESTIYRGGVVIRGYLKGADTNAAPLELAYMLSSTPYIVLGQRTTWKVTITGGTGDYTCSALLFRQELDAPDNLYWRTASVALTDNLLEYTFTQEGRYFWEFRVLDEGGEYFSFQTRPYETYTEADETNPNTAAGKANRVVAEVITPGMSDYDRARALHDWLIYNANYDYSSNPHRTAAGVLVYGTGVCDSYARAYLMLCTIAGLDCMIITGDAMTPDGWGAHAWNMVKLNGKWYHVDCTWDDPGTGGYEYHEYFCVDDETLSKDHRWNTPDGILDEGYIPPEVEGGEFEDSSDALVGDYDFTFTTWEEFFEKFDAMVEAGERRDRTYGLYTGDLTSAEMYSTMGQYSSPKTQELYDRGLANGGSRGYSGRVFFYRAKWYETTSYIRIDEPSVRVSIGRTATIVPSEYSPQSNAFTWTSSNPDVATVSASYDDNLGLTATITGVSAGEATITATASGGASDSVTVTVLPAFEPDFGLNTATDSDGVTLSWEDIPGVTEYLIYRRYNGTDTLLETTNNTRVYMSSDRLPSNVEQELYIIGIRAVGGQTVFSYTSEPITYGKLTLSYTSSLSGSLTVIEDEAFENCTYLTSLKLPGRLTYIGEAAFAGCTNLTTIRIPASVTYIGEDAFEDCPLQYAEVSPGSYAEEWLLKHFPNIHLVY